MNLLEKNSLIATKLLDWNILSLHSCPSYKFIKNEYFDGGIRALTIENNANLQWLCIEKIMLSENNNLNDIPSVINFLNRLWKETQVHQTTDNEYSYVNMKTLGDMFEAIFIYVRDEI